MMTRAVRESRAPNWSESQIKMAIIYTCYETLPDVFILSSASPSLSDRSCTAAINI